MMIWPTYWIVVLLLVFMIAWWRQTRSENAGWVDVIWAFATGITALIAIYNGQGDPELRWLLGTLTLLWFTRLGWHLLSRVKSSREDTRYRYMRESVKNRQSVFFLFYLAQFSWVLIFSLPSGFAAQGHNPPLWALILALFIFAGSWFGVSSADHQLARFKADPLNQGKTCDQGLWRYSRHPNYFFEWLHWFSFPLLGWNSPYADLLWLSPLVMFIFLFYMTGIPFSEQQAIRTRGENYRHYQIRTPIFFPWRPKS